MSRTVSEAKAKGVLMSKKNAASIQLFNTVVQFDIYIAAHSKEEAEAAVLAAIQQGEKPMEVFSYAILNPRDIRNDWREERPLVAAEVSDEEWQPFTGKTTHDFFMSVSLPKDA